MTTLVTSLPESSRHRLLLWMTREEFSVLLEVIKSKVAVEMATHTKLVLATPQEHISASQPTPAELEALRQAAAWQLTHDKLISLQAQVANESESVLIGKHISVD